MFVQPLPDPQWTAATGSFKALIAANDEPVPQEPVAGGPVEVEIDAAFFASMLGAEGAPTVSQPLPVPEPAGRERAGGAGSGATGKSRHARSAGTRARGPRPGNARSARHPYPCSTARMPMATASILKEESLRGGPDALDPRTRTQRRRPRSRSPRSHACGSTAGHWARWSRCCCSLRRW